MKRIAVINQRYGREVNGGSELYSRQIAELLALKYDVEVLTTCSLDYVPWKNYYKSGVEEINGVKVRRFPVDYIRNPKIFVPLNEEMHQNPYASEEIAQKWMDELGPFCPKLIQYVKNHQEDYDVFIVVTYLYYTAVRSLEVIGYKAIFIPTAHQEPYFHFKIYEDVFKAPKGYVFLTDEEKELVQGKFPIANKPYEVMGVGVDVPDVVDSDKFKKKYALDNYIIYVGRIDEGKDCPRMFRYFMEYKKRNLNDLKLVLMGKAVVNIPKHPDIISLGFVSDEDKFDGIKGARALILPSKYESLSISVLEAMSIGTPVIVNGKCAVLKGHCIKSNGALYYENYFEFEGEINYLINHPEEAKKMSVNAQHYVKQNYQWKVIAEKFSKLIEKIDS